MSDSESLEGHTEIREFIDAEMSASYYKKHIVPKIECILMERTYKKWGKPRIFTYKNLLLARLLEIRKL